MIIPQKRVSLWLGVRQGQLNIEFCFTSGQLIRHTNMGIFVFSVLLRMITVMECHPWSFLVRSRRVVRGSVWMVVLKRSFSISSGWLHCSLSRFLSLLQNLLSHHCILFASSSWTKCILGIQVVPASL